MYTSRFNLLLMLFIATLFASCGNKNGESDAYGNIETDDVTISSEVSGKLIQLNIDEGDRVTKNQAIGLVDTIQLQLKLNQLYAQTDAAKAKLQSINAQVAVQDEQIRVIKVELDRVSSLVADSAATQRQFDDVNGKYSVALRQKSSIEVQQNGVIAEMAAITAQIDQVKDQIQRCKVLSPIQGTVAARYVRQGELVSVGKPMCRVAKLDTVYARVYIDETQLSNFKIGTTVKVFTDSSNGNLDEVDGVVTWISSEAEFTPKVIQTRNERANLVYAAKVRIPNTNGSYKIGMPVEVKILSK
ncbi:MAG: HlyD family secretion protein [Bacteroidales bacterium]